MGTDIHIHMEYRSRKKKQYRYGGQMYGERLYGVFEVFADGRKHCIRGWYLDQRFRQEDCPRGYHMYDFRSSDGDGEYLCTIEPKVWVNHSGTFVTRTEIPFNVDGNPDWFEVKYGHFY